MMLSQLPALLDVTLVLAVGAWACRFMWRRFRPSRAKRDSGCDACDKCRH